MVKVTATEKIYYNFTKVETWDANGGFIGDSDRLLLGLRLSPTDTRGVPEFPPPL